MDEVPEEDKYKEKYSKLSAELTQLKTAKKLLEREKVLMAMANEGYQFSMQEELCDSSEMDDAQFSKHVARIQDLVRKPPLAKNLVLLTLGLVERLVVSLT